MVNIVRKILIMVIRKSNSKRKKKAEAKGDLIGNNTDNKKLHNKMIQRQLQMKNDKEIPKERYLSPEERQEIIDELRLI